MKKIIIGFAASLFLFLSLNSCKDVLNVKPDNLITGKEVFLSNTSIKAFMATLYNDLPLQDLNYNPQPKNYMANITGEAINNPYRNLNSLGNGTWLGWWNDGYKAIRQVNTFLDNIESADIEAGKKKRLRGEAEFLRAYYYFELVKRYGGVPIIKKVQQYKGSSDVSALQKPRDKEKRVYDFIGAQLDSAANMMDINSIGRGRANKYVAYALKSRAMLYAASASAFAPVQKDGVLGIPSSDAKHYWQEAYDAAEKVIKSGKYSLYDKYPSNRKKNFTQLFRDQDNNPEVIFARYYSYPKKTNGWLNNAKPWGECGGHVDPTLEFVNSFEYKDGSNGRLKLKDKQGNYIEYKDPADLFKNKDPRFAATILYPMASWTFNPTGKVDVRAGIIDNGKTITSGNYDTMYKGMHVIGNRGIGGNLGNSPTGFYARKYLKPSPPYPEGSSPPCTIPATVRYIEFRLGGVLLNYAEAAFELNKVGDAKQAINKVRKRAGVKPLSSSEVTEKAIRHEREVELAFEGGQRYWDITRWRIANKLIDNTQYTALYPYYKFQDKAYIFKTKKVGFSLTFFSRLYYRKVPSGTIRKNPKLVQNPGY
jgi:hypothetical protein